MGVELFFLIVFTATIVFSFIVGMRWGRESNNKYVVPESKLLEVQGYIKTTNDFTNEEFQEKLLAWFKDQGIIFQGYTKLK